MAWRRSSRALRQPAPARPGLLPWALVGFDDPADGPIALRYNNAGIDFEADLGKGFTTTVTLNTDFTQVEVDDVTTNLDHFDRFVPEKRDFFLKDGDLFAFGEGDWTRMTARSRCPSSPA